MRQYLKSFQLLTRDEEENFLFYDRRPWLSSKYPFHVFRFEQTPKFEFAPITIFCGGNGCGKSTVLNVIAEKLRLKRGAVYNRSEAFEDYVRLCKYQKNYGAEIPPESRIITSDDVFDYLLDIRYINSGVDKNRNELFDTYFKKRAADEEESRLRSLADYDRWRDIYDAKKDKKAQPYGFVRDRVMRNVQERSNGESALMYFTEEIRHDALYLLDEPENSLSAEFQQKLKSFLEASIRAYNCQFILSTHSPFLLSIPDALIYDLDEEELRVKSWAEIKNVQIYHDFFLEHDKEFPNQ